MKKLLALFAFLGIFTMVAFAQTNTNEPIKSSTHDFGKVPQGTPVSHEFKFKNESKVPVIIENVSSSCGCTVPNWTRNPILPGQTGTVAATYNAANMGNFNRPVTVHYKVGEEKFQVQMFLKGEVIDKNAVSSGAPEKSDNILRK